ncbi:MAG: hypothetical protein NTW11_04140, partial [Candidatus Staskawiczbacteria bacterium]|nr:hypothetical protein [Candidatus Staskawiczbacteria bacterium]
GSCTNQTINCSTNSQCGTSGVVGSPYCQGGNVYNNYKTYTCNNAGTANSYCSDSTASQLQTTCSGTQICANGSCTNQTINCSTNSQCGTSGVVGSPYCQGGNVYNNYKTYTCNNAGTANSYCSDSTASQLQTTCSGTQICANGSCTNSCTQNYQQRCLGTSMYWYDSCGNIGSYVGTCGNACTSNYQQRCSGSSLYWYDSCGAQQSLIQYCANGCSGNACLNYTNGTLTVNKTVKNLTTGTGFVSSVYANPSDMLMFMITLQANGGQNIQNVVVRDALPSSLIYNNQLVVACTGNSSNCNNYSGDITTGINFYSISVGQTITITYQAQVASAANFSYGTTTLNNSVSVTGSQLGYTPTSNASVFVTKAGVLGASIVSTGLTNNFWLDSFFLPLLLTLIVIWMWRSGIFFGIEKWFNGKTMTFKDYKAEKELSKRISQIQKSGRA